MLKKELKSEIVNCKFRPSVVKQIKKIAFMKNLEFTDYLQQLMIKDIQNNEELLELYKEFNESPKDIVVIM